MGKFKLADKSGVIIMHAELELNVFCSAFKDHGDIFRLRGLAQEIIFDPTMTDLKVTLAQFDITVYKIANDTRFGGKHFRGFFQGDVTLPTEFAKAPAAPANAMAPPAPANASASAMAIAPAPSPESELQKSVEEQVAANTAEAVEGDEANTAGAIYEDEDAKYNAMIEAASGEYEEYDGEDNDVPQVNHAKVSGNVPT